MRDIAPLLRIPGEVKAAGRVLEEGREVQVQTPQDLGAGHKPADLLSSRARGPLCVLGDSPGVPRGAQQAPATPAWLPLTVDDLVLPGRRRLPLTPPHLDVHLTPPR